MKKNVRHSARSKGWGRNYPERDLTDLRKLPREAESAQSVKRKFLDTICAPNRDTHFFVGTVLNHGTWVIVGTFWPKRKLEPGLFD